MIYFIRAGTDGPVKIGYAASVERRVALIQAGNHQRFTLLRTLPGDRQTEGWLHRHFAAARIDREWFAFDAEMLTIEPPVEIELTLSLPRPMRSLPRPIGLFGGPKAVADLLGLDVSAVHRWGYPRERGGSAGCILAKHQRALLAAARKRKIALSPADFFDEVAA